MTFSIALARDSDSRSTSCNSISTPIVGVSFRVNSNFGMTD